MGYIVDYGIFDALETGFVSAVNSWLDGISSVMSAEGTVEGSTNISGNSADRTRAYLNTVYSYASTSFSVLLTAFRDNFLVYTNDYRSNIDGAGDTYIDTAELSDLSSSLQVQRSLIRETAMSAETVIKSVSDIVSVSIPDISAADSQLGTILTAIEELNNDISALEAAHSSGDFGDLDTLVTQLGSYISEVKGQSEAYKTEFTTAAFASLASVPTLVSAMNSVYASTQAQSTEIAAAQESLQARLEAEQAELEKRQEDAKWMKTAANIGVSIISVGLTAVLTPALGPAAVIVSGAVCGAAKSALSEAADQYAEKGWNFEEWDTDRITIHGCIGAVTGMVGSLVPADAGACVEAGVSALSSAFEGIASTSYDQLADYGRITDVGEIAEDAVIKGVSSFVGTMIGNEVSDELSGLVKSNDKIKDLAENVVGGVEHFGAVLQVEGLSKVGSGIAERFSSGVVEDYGEIISDIADGESVEEAFSDYQTKLSDTIEATFEPSKLVGDAGGAVVTAATDDPLYESEKKLNDRSGGYAVLTAEERSSAEHEAQEYSIFGDAPDLNGKEDAWDDWDSEEYDRMMEKLAEMDARGEDAENYEIFGDPRELKTQRKAAVKEAWEDELELVAQGKGTRDWSVSQQEELYRTGKVSGMEGQHMVSVSSDASLAGNPDNIQFLTYEEHLYGAHDGNFQNSTSGRYNTETGEMETIKSTDFLPHRNLVAQELSQKFDYTQADLAEQLGSDFGYGRGKKS